jgi:hypothetical protein
MLLPLNCVMQARSDQVPLEFGYLEHNLPNTQKPLRRSIDTHLLLPRPAYAFNAIRPASSLNKAAVRFGTPYKDASSVRK